jgi:hypothetical protein
VIKGFMGCLPFERFLRSVDFEVLDPGSDVEVAPFLEVRFVVIHGYTHADLFFAVAFAAFLEKAPALLSAEKEVGVAVTVLIFQDDRQIIIVPPIAPIYFGNSPEPFGLTLAEAGIFAEEPFISEVEQ